MKRSLLIVTLTLLFVTLASASAVTAQQPNVIRRPHHHHRYQTFNQNGVGVITDPRLGYYYGSGYYPRRYYNSGYYSRPYVGYGYGYGGGPIFDARAFGYSTYGF